MEQNSMVGGKNMKVVLQNLTKQFPSRSKKSPELVVAVNDFTFEIPGRAS